MEQSEHKLYVRTYPALIFETTVASDAKGYLVSNPKLRNPALLQKLVLG